MSRVNGLCLGSSDGHIHLESSMLLPSRLAKALIPHGTAVIVSDPHEIANVQGISGIRFLLKQSENLPMDIFFYGTFLCSGYSNGNQWGQLKRE